MNFSCDFLKNCFKHCKISVSDKSLVVQRRQISRKIDVFGPKHQILPTVNLTTHTCLALKDRTTSTNLCFFIDSVTFPMVSWLRKSWIYVVSWWKTNSSYLCVFSDPWKARKFESKRKNGLQCSPGVVTSLSTAEFPSRLNSESGVSPSVGISWILA